MSITSLIQLALAILRLANWLTRKVDQHQWEASGFKRAMEAEVAGINQAIGYAVEEREAAHKLTPEERRRRLEEPV